MYLVLPIFLSLLLRIADPLSIIASIIAVIEATKSVNKTLNRLRDIIGASAKVLVLSNEISDLTVILKSLKTYVATADRAVISSEQLKKLLVLTERAYSRLAQLQEIMYNYFP